ncbi:MAG TPA: FHA domain-containing protein [Rhodopila sp.]|uniref:FHA domain-containing protein n=1 Tax=Rhodopila sp. TaxID=2480087 RepID=UPI002B9E97C9|nr:FHA domain-containing protein [Rhodopila sp.]HVY18150.1 FHA domain-containing protein [Rhodopila sp.]
MHKLDVLRLILGYQDAWFVQFPQLSRRAEWHMLNHLATKGRNGAPAGELYGLVKQVFLLDDATVKERLTSISQMALCHLDPPGQVFARTVVTPTQEFLGRFDAHLADFAQRLADIAGVPSIARVGEPSAQWRSQVLRPLEIYNDCWLSATDAIFNQTGLSPARRSDARRHLISSSHWNLIHTAFRWHHEAAPEPTPILADRLAARLLELTGQTVQTTKDHIGYLIELGLFQRVRGRALHVMPSELALHYIGWALQQTGAALPPLLATLAVGATTLGPAVMGSNEFPFADGVEDETERTLNLKQEGLRHVLEIVSPPSLAQRFEIHPPATVGRMPPSEVLLSRSDVSRAHCRIEQAGPWLLLSDLNSTNGTFVNDRRIDAPMRLNPGDRLRIGSFILRYDMETFSEDQTQRGSVNDKTAIRPSACE